MKNIHRTDKSDNFTIVDNRLIRDRRLSLSAKGLALVLLERPDDWKIYARDIVKRSSDGKATLGKCLDELEELGYLSRRRMRGNHGRFNGWDVQFYESPELNPLFNKTLTINRNTGIGEPRIGDTVFGETEIGVTENGISAPTKDGSEPIPDLNQKRKEKKTDGTVGNAREQRENHQPTTKTAAAAAEIFKILVSVSGQMPKPLQAPESLLAGLHERGETAESTKQAWEACKTNARKPSGAFVYWLKSGYLPQQTSSLTAKKSEDPPQFRFTPPADSSSGCDSFQKTAEERKARAAAELAAMRMKTEADSGGDEQKARDDQQMTKKQPEESEEARRARKKAEIAAMLAKSRGGSR